MHGFPHAMIPPKSIAYTLGLFTLHKPKCLNFHFKAASGLGN